MPSHARALETTAKVSAAAAGSGAATWLGYQFLQYQARAARVHIGRPRMRPPQADGVYTAEPGPPQRYGDADLRLMVFGDSTAAGLGCQVADEVPGVLIARALAAETGKRVRLSTKAIVGATSRGLASQVDAMFIAGPSPDAAVILVGANDVTSAQPPHVAAKRVGDAVGRLVGSGAGVVVGTCPDLGVIAAIPQPLRTVTRRWGLHLAKLQAEQTRKAGGVPVPLADLLAPEFLAAPDMMFSPDRFHPSAAGYALAAEQLFPALCDAMGIWRGGPLPELPAVSATAEAMRPLMRARSALNHLVGLGRGTGEMAVVQGFLQDLAPARAILEAGDRQQS